MRVEDRVEEQVTRLMRAEAYGGACQEEWN
jgi:hypothetical protein